MQASSRRTFLGRSLQTAGLLGLALRPGRTRAADDAKGIDLSAKAATFLLSRQAADGTWSADRKEPGITALVVTGLLRSKRVFATDPAVTRALTYLEGFAGPDGGLSEAPHAN